jgi:hypothetical protein
LANERKTGADKKDAPATSEKHYSIRHTIVLGKGDDRESRSTGTVTASEVGGEAVIQQLLSVGAIVDPDIALGGVELAEQRVRSVVIDIARRGGIIHADGDRYTFDSKTYSGADELQRLPFTTVADAIVAALTGE